MRLLLIVSVVSLAAGCAPGHCGNGMLDGDETDVDCGGSECSACGDRAACKTGSDCSAGRCSNMLCGGPYCDDGLRNGDETDVDCGGTLCLSCGTGRSCLADRDCAAHACIASRCAACGDQLKDGGPGC